MLYGPVVLRPGRVDRAICHFHFVSCGYPRYAAKSGAGCRLRKTIGRRFLGRHKTRCFRGGLRLAIYRQDQGGTQLAPGRLLDFGDTDEYRWWPTRCDPSVYCPAHSIGRRSATSLDHLGFDLERIQRLGRIESLRRVCGAGNQSICPDAQQSTSIRQRVFSTAARCTADPAVYQTGVWRAGRLPTYELGLGSRLLKKIRLCRLGEL